MTTRAGPTGPLPPLRDEDHHDLLTNSVALSEGALALAQVGAVVLETNGQMSVIGAGSVGSGSVPPDA
ncbi:MAG: hypothetical protein ABIS35_02575 [Terracoccus sp.]